MRTAQLWNGLLQKRGIAVTLLKQCGNMSLLLVYRPDFLKWDLRAPNVAAYLRECGYEDPLNVTGAIGKLRMRLQTCDSFPHEIGLFLGYPLQDVRGFIENKGRNHCLCGCWKVYADPEEAMRKFSLFKKCGQVYRRHYHNGRSALQLAVVI